MEKSLARRIALFALLLFGLGEAFASETAGSPPDLRSYTETPTVRSLARLEQQASEATVDQEVDRAVLLTRRARETAEPSFYEEAHLALDAALNKAPSHPRAQRTRIAVLLGQHRFQEAVTQAERQLKAAGDRPHVELLAYALDSYVEVGRYDDAWEILPYLLADSPGSPAVLARASYLAELAGDLRAATELMDRAERGTPPSDTEGKAWFSVQLAHLAREQGDLDVAEAYLRAALAQFPGYHYAFGERAKLEAARERHVEALRWMERRCTAAPHPECFYDLGVARERAGQAERAEQDFERFVKGALAESEAVDNANLELVRYYLSRNEQTRAMRLASRERKRRADVKTRAVYALALVANDRVEAAKAEVNAIRDVGTQDRQVMKDLDAVDRALRGERVEVIGRLRDLRGIATSATEGSTGRAELRSRPIQRAGELVETVPGLIATQHSGAGKANQYFLRGFNLDHGTDLLIQVDGVPVNLPTHGHGQGYADLSFVIPEMVEQVDYRKGAYSAAVGDFGAAGSADVQWVDELPPLAVSVTQGGDGYERLHARGELAVGTGRVVSGVEHKRSAGPWIRPDDAVQTNALLRYLDGDAQRGWSASALVYDGRWNSTDQIPLRVVDTTVPRFGAIDPELGGASRRLGLTFESHRLDASSRRTFNAFLTGYELDLVSNFTYCAGQQSAGCAVDADRFLQTDERWSGGARWEGTRLFSNDSSLRGLSWGTQVQVQSIQNALGPVSDSGAPSDRLARRDRTVQVASGVYGSLELRPVQRLKLIAGARADAMHVDVETAVGSNDPADVGPQSLRGRRGSTILSPKLSAIYRPVDTLELYLNAGRGFHSNDARGQTTRRDLRTGELLAPADPLVRATTADLGLRVSAADRYQSTLSFFGVDLDSELLYVGDEGRNEAGPASRRVGVEWTNYLRLFNHLILDVDATWVDATLQSADPNETEIPGAINRTVAAGVAWNPSAGLSGSLRLRHFGGYPLTEDGRVQADSSTTVNAQLNYSFRDGLNLRVDGFNLLNRQQADSQYFYASRLPAAFSPTGEDEPVGGVEDIHFHPSAPRNLRVTLEYRF